MPAKQKQPVYVLGVGMTKFLKPRGKVDYTELGFEAGVKAMLDAHIDYDEVDQGVACYCYGDSTCGQRVFYQFGMTGIPIYNVNNNCSTGSTALYQANMLVRSGLIDCALALGFERMKPGSLGTNWTDRPPPGLIFNEASSETEELMSAGTNFGPGAPRMFANGAQEYFEKYGANIEHLAKIGT